MSANPPRLDHVAEDLTVTVDAAWPLVDLQRALARQGQWLPVDPPGNPTIRDVLDGNLGGPRRYGYGTVREHVIGLGVRLPNGTPIKAGGRVVKNVAGYDLCRLFTGAGGKLGTIEQATFKLQPRPETERVLARSCDSLAEAGQCIDAVMAAPWMPVILDLVAPATVVVGFAGVREDVDGQCDEARSLGLAEPCSLDYDRAWPQQVSVLPSRLVATLEELGATTFVARAGNGVIGCPAEVVIGSPRAASEIDTVRRHLERRLEEVFGA